MTTPTTNQTQIARVAREADIDLRHLDSRPPYSIPQSIRAAAPEIDAAAKRYSDIVKQRGDAARRCREALSAVNQIRGQHEKAITRAALEGKAEPKPVDVSAQLDEAREHYRRARALTRATLTAGSDLISALEGAHGLLATLRKQERATAKEALDMFQQVDAVLLTFAELRSEADWLENVIARAEHGQSTAYHHRPKPVPSTVEEAHVAVRERA